MTKLSWLAALAVIPAFAVFACDSNDAPSPSPSLTSSSDAETVTPSATATVAPPAPTAVPNREGTPQGDGTFVVVCGDVLAPVDKEHRLPAGCEPGDLVTLPGEMSVGGAQLMRAEAAEALGKLFAAAQGDGFTIVAASSYRSYETQVIVYAGHVARSGQAAADRISARPGRSEHQLGTTTDVTSASAGFGLDGFRGTPEAAWLAENAWRFGFVISYPEGKEAITGYVYEPWHIRWIGIEEAARIRDSGLTLHEWLLR